MRNIIVLSVLLFLASSLEATKPFKDGKLTCRGMKCAKKEMCVMRIETDNKSAYPHCVKRQPSGPMCSSLLCPAGSQCTKDYDVFSTCLMRSPTKEFEGATVGCTTMKTPEKPTQKNLQGAIKKSTTPKSASPEKSPQQSLQGAIKKSTTPKPTTSKKPPRKI